MTYRLILFQHRQIRGAGVFIARQHAMHAQRDIVRADLSVCLSNAELFLNEWTYPDSF